MLTRNICMLYDIFIDRFVRGFSAICWILSSSSHDWYNCRQLRCTDDRRGYGRRSHTVFGAGRNGQSYPTRWATIWDGQVLSHRWKYLLFHFDVTYHKVCATYISTLINPHSLLPHLRATLPVMYDMITVSDLSHYDGNINISPLWKLHLSKMIFSPGKTGTHAIEQ